MKEIHWMRFVKLGDRVRVKTSDEICSEFRCLPEESIYKGAGFFRTAWENCGNTGIVYEKDGTAMNLTINGDESQYYYSDIYCVPVNTRFSMLKIRDDLPDDLKQIIKEMCPLFLDGNGDVFNPITYETHLAFRNTKDKVFEEEEISFDKYKEVISSFNPEKEPVFEIELEF